MRKLSLALLALAVIVPARAHAADSKDAAAKPAAGETGGEASGGEEGDNQQKQNEKSGAKTLEERIRPVSGSLFIRKSRSELEPVVGISFNDAFFQKYMFGLRYAYHATDSFSVELGGAFGISMPSGEVNTCTAQGCVTPTKDQLQGTPGNVGLIIGASGVWAPLYGKINLVGEKVLHFDTFFLGGLDGLSYAVPSVDPSVAPTSTFTFGGHFGIGQHFVINDFTALRVELRDYLYSGQRAVNGVLESHLENQFMLDIGVSFFFPLHPTE
ncbi:MAG: outer membrane beta-barrel domain-containing protein [Deltaproteobacteria bacterium]|nr:outer membrane beta-barrel domain-containing protein [Deltaproteobacteria bacterium]